MQLAAVYSDVGAGGGDLWAIAPQPVAPNRALRQRYDLPFPILSDQDQAVIHAWGIYNHLDPKGRAIPYPATYVVGGDGRVAWRSLGLETRDRPAPGAVLAALRAAGQVAEEG